MHDIWVCTMKRSTKTIIQYTIAVGLLISGIMLTLIGSISRNGNRTMEYVGRYIDELSVTTATHVADVLEDKLDTIETMAYLYGQSATGVDEEMLAKVEERSGFDWMRFLTPDGTDHTSDGQTTDVGDREYFLRGMEGSSGMCEVLQSRINGEKLIGFYAPVYDKDTVSGVLVGFLSAQTVSDILAADPYDFPADTHILRQDGTDLGAYLAAAKEDGCRLLQMDKPENADGRAEMLSAAKAQKSCRFTFRGLTDESVGCVEPIRGTDWSLVQIFPPEAARVVVHAANKDAVKTLVTTLLIFLCFIVFLIISYRKSAQIRSKELARNQINVLMRNVTEDYAYLIDVDLETKKEVPYQLDAGADMDYWVAEGQEYNRGLVCFASTYVAEYDRARFMEHMNLTTLTEVLKQQKDFYIEYDAVVKGQTRRFQEKCTISDAEPFANHMLISIRDISDSTAQLENDLDQNQKNA